MNTNRISDNRAPVFYKGFIILSDQSDVALPGKNGKHTLRRVVAGCHIAGDNRSGNHEASIQIAVQRLIFHVDFYIAGAEIREILNGYRVLIRCSIDQNGSKIIHFILDSNGRSDCGHVIEMNRFAAGSHKIGL